MRGISGCANAGPALAGAAACVTVIPLVDATDARRGIGDCVVCTDKENAALPLDWNPVSENDCSSSRGRADAGVMYCDGFNTSSATRSLLLPRNAFSGL